MKHQLYYSRDHGVDARALPFTVVFYGLRNLCCKTEQPCATQCKDLTTETPSVGDAMQSSEMMPNSLGLNYKSAALSGCVTVVNTGDSLLFGGLRGVDFAVVALHSLLQLLTFWPICKGTHVPYGRLCCFNLPVATSDTKSEKPLPACSVRYCPD